MINYIRKSRIIKVISFLLIFQILLPMNIWAVTGGPSQPEFKSFTQIGANDMVNLFSGDFQYNIPLLDVGGYPVSISYSSGIGMEDQASIVGLGWTLNAGGQINRAVRGIPDDFNGEDKIITVTHLEPNWTVGANVSFDFEAAGVETSSFFKVSKGMGFNILYNNYSGFGLELSASVSLSGTDKCKYPNGISLGLNPKLSTESGFTVSGNVSMNKTFSDEKAKSELFGSVGIGNSINSRGGLRSCTVESNSKIAMSYKTEAEETDVKEKNVTQSSSIPIGISSYIPQITQPMRSYAAAVDIGGGAIAKWMNPKGKIGGFFSMQEISSPVIKSSAYGYLYSEKGKNNEKAMHDFNREKDCDFTEKTPALPLSQMTYDIYTAMGQGLNGMFRPFRDYGMVYDPRVYTTSGDGSLGVDLGAGDLGKGGANVGFSYHESTSGRWKNGIGFRNKIAFREKQDKSVYEHVYFKSAGEFNTIDASYFENIQGFNTVLFPVNKDGEATGRYMTASGKSVGTVSNRRTLRDKRNLHFSYLTAAEASKAGLEKTMFNYTTTPNGEIAYTILNRCGSDGRQPHHISEITVTTPDGLRYVYGSQTYNYIQKEVTFNAKGTVDSEKGLISYTPGVDNSVNNKNGITHYYNSSILPAYASAYQLTALLSSDYVDVTGDGPSFDDLGTYTKFNYTQLYDETNPYQWRNPYYENQANYQEGYKSKTNDDKGTYLYGKKEIKILHSIETKNFIAFFNYSDRADAYGVKGENGGRSTNQTLKKLDSIVLYSRNKMEEPIKTVHFVYDYLLCKGIPSSSSNGGGKLTLTKVYFTYGRSLKGSHLPYEFTYGTNNNYNYHLRHIDRWGTYKPQQSGKSNLDDPYVIQDKPQRDIYAAAWCLTSIKLPSASTVDVEYESDDYAFVQDKRAASMVKILGFGANDESFENYSSKLYDGNENYNYVYFSAPAKNKNDFLKKYLTNADGSRLKYLYFKCYVNLSNSGDSEYVSGYVDIEKANYSWKENVACIQLGTTKLDDTGVKKIHPVSKTAMQYVRLNMPDLYLGGNNDCGMGEKLLRKLAGMISDILIIGQGADAYMYRLRFCNYLDSNKNSYIRLLNPEYCQLGDGSRVKSVSVNDKWTTMSGNGIEDFKYGQVYDYKKVSDSRDVGIPEGTIISSGVTPYEPPFGGDENVLKVPVYYSEKNLLAPDNRFYQEKPYGETFYPSAAVGYSSVTVYDQKGDLQTSGTASRTVNEYYTAKDFPVITQNPKMNVKPNPPSLASKMLNIAVEDRMTVSQGFSIELNDMHGKEKARRMYAEGQGTPISEIEYYYKTEGAKKLSNRINTIDKSGRFNKEVLAGVNIDMSVDEREQYSYTRGGSVDMNFSISTVPFPIPFPLLIPLPWLKYNSEKTSFRSLSNTKIVTRYGVLDRVVAKDLGSRTETRNLAWDNETGEVLLTCSENEFGDSIYSFNYPAHWAYDGMGPVYQNTGYENSKLKFSYIDFPENYFIEGDELLVDGETRAWVSKVNKGVKGSIEVVDDLGNKITGTKSIKTIRSGRKNLQSVSVGNVTTKTSPVSGEELKFKDVINSGAVVFADKWENGVCDGCLESSQLNDFLLGKSGNFRAKASYAFLTGRTQTQYNRSTDIANDGLYTNYNDFWHPNKGMDWYIAPNNGWTFVSEVTMFSPYGFELENRDALGRYSSADYGYNYTLPIFVSGNARYKEAGFSGFEDMKLNDCHKVHFNPDELSESTNVEKERSHSGRYSVKVPASGITYQRIVVSCEEAEIPVGTTTSSQEQSTEVKSDLEIKGSNQTN